MAAGKYEPRPRSGDEPQRRRSQGKKKPPIVRAFQRTVRRAQKQFKQNRQNGVSWFWDLRLWMPLIVILFIVNSCSVSQGEPPEPAQESESMQSESAQPTVIVLEETLPTAPELDDEAVALARLADSVARSYTDNVKRIIMWIVINRVEDRANGYGGSLIAEINRPNQWQCYDPDSFYLESTYEIALEVVTQWRENGARPLYNDMLWFRFNSDGSITVRNKYKSEKNRVEMTFE